MQNLQNSQLDFHRIRQARHWRSDKAGVLPPAAYMESHCLDSGFVLFISDIILENALSLECRNLESCVGFGYCHVGDMVLKPSDTSWPERINQGQMAFFSSPGFDCWSESFGKNRTTRISISVRKSMVEILNEAYEGLLERAGFRSADPFLEAYTPGADVRRVLGEILQCPYQGPLRSVYLEAKGLELFVGSLGDLGASARGGSPPLDRRQVEQAEMAACLLVESFEAVPSLSEVARQVGLSRCRLADVFQKVHGATPFAWLRAKRLETAKDMLSQGAANVTEAAMAVGYSSVSHFTKAFTSRFDIHPSQCRKRSKAFSL